MTFLPSLFQQNQHLIPHWKISTTFHYFLFLQLTEGTDGGNEYRMRILPTQGIRVDQDFILNRPSSSPELDYIKI